MPNWIKWALAIVAGLLMGTIITGIAVHERRPPLKASVEADKMAEKMLEALNVTAWDSVRTIAWRFMGGRRYRWNKRQDSVKIKWSDVVVDLHTTSVTGNAYKSGALLHGEAANRAVDKAWQYFCNDSFWLIAPYKVFDPGTARGLVDLEGGETGLLVSYTSGGVTPGDSYLWLLDDEYRPRAWKMWVEVIPIGGIKVKWEGWNRYAGGVVISTVKRAGPFELPIDGIEIDY